MLNTLPSTQITLPPVLRRRRGAQPGNHNARRDGTFSRLDPGPLAPIRLKVRSLNTALNDYVLPQEKVIKQARTARKTLDRSPISSFTSQVHAIRLSLRINALISRALAPVHAATRPRKPPPTSRSIPSHLV